MVEKKPYFPRKGKHHARITSTDSIDSFTSSTSSSASSSISSSPIRTSFTEKRTLLSPYDTSWNGGVGEGGRGGRSSIHVAGRHSISGSDAHHFLNIPSTIGEDHKRFKGHKKSISLSNYVSVSSSSATIPYPHYHHTTNNSLPPPPRGYYQQSLEQRSLEHPVVQLRMPPISRLHIGSGNRIHRDANIVETSYVTSSSSSSSASPSTTSRFTYNNDPNFDQSIINGPAETSNIVVAVVNSNPFSLASLLSK